MAIEPMHCPISGRGCKRCAIYRGRHVNLCFFNKYEGPLPAPSEVHIERIKHPSSRAYFQGEALHREVI